MNEIWDIFKSQNNTEIEDTIVAGYGNKATDTKAYVNSGIPLDAVYIVNPEGELKNEGTGEVTSYKEQTCEIGNSSLIHGNIEYIVYMFEIL